eukprot:symbB.v1.2.012597.t1/scaffold820.1/size171332/4
MDDGLSNANRATLMPFCIEPMYLSTFGKMAQRQISEELRNPEQRALPLLRVWEVGANMGDCSLFALHCVSAWGPLSAQPRSLLDVELSLFEPIADSVVASTAAVNAFVQRQRAVGNLRPPRIVVG